MFGCVKDAFRCKLCRANLDFAKTEALTTYGQIGVKVWIYKGEAVPEEVQEKAETATEGVYVSE